MNSTDDSEPKDSQRSPLSQALRLVAALAPFAIGAYWLKGKLAWPPPIEQPVQSPPPPPTPVNPRPAKTDDELTDEEWRRQGIGNRRRIVNGVRMYKDNWGEWQEA